MTRKLITIIFAIILLATAAYFYFSSRSGFKAEPIKVGILHSLSGTMAISEKPVVHATLMAISEINAQGGILGREIVPIIVDGRSDWPTFAQQAEDLIVKHKVSAVFGCWTSASRKTVKPIFEQYNHILFYPVQYEGIENSPNIVYTGAVPNQQIIPAVKWSFDHLGKKYFLIGSDYVFPRIANEIIKDLVTILGGQIVGEEYLPLGSDNVDEVVRQIKEAKPDVIINTINGNSNVFFFHELYKTHTDIPVMSFSIAEHEIQMIGVKYMEGNYASWNYYQSIDTEENRKFVQHFKDQYGQDKVVDDPMEAGYFGVYLWAQAVEEAETDNVHEVRKAIKDQSFLAPEGMVYVDHHNNHLWKQVRIGKILKNGQFDIVWNSNKPIKPKPYPAYRGKTEWDKFLNSLYQGWDQNWANPGN